MKGYWHDHLLVRLDVFVARDFVRDDVVDDDDLREVVVEPGEVSSTTAFLMQTTGGNPSHIFCHVLPSSVELKSLPLRVPK